MVYPVNVENRSYDVECTARFVEVICCKGRCFRVGPSRKMLDLNGKKCSVIVTKSSFYLRALKLELL